MIIFTTLAQETIFDVYNKITDKINANCLEKLQDNLRTLKSLQRKKKIKLAPYANIYKKIEIHTLWIYDWYQIWSFIFLD